MKTLCILLIGLFGFTAVEQNNPTTITITGQVLDENQQALIGATVREAGTTNATLTDVDGFFELQVQPNASVEVIYVGYTTHTFSLGQQKNFTIQLQASNQIDEVVVQGLATKRRRHKLGYSEVKIKGNTALSSRAPGIVVSDYYAHNTEDYSGFEENTFKRVADAPLTTFSIDVDRAAYSNVRRFLNDGLMPPVGAVRVEEMINYFHYDYTEPTGAHPFEVGSTVVDSPWNPDLKLVHIGLQGKRINTAELPPSNLVFLLDVSGSMSSSNKLPLVKSAFNLLVDQLRPEDQVAIVVYAGAAGMVLPPTSGAEKMKLKEAINNLNAGGSTAGGAGIKLAYKTALKSFIEGGNNRVVLATDGDFNVGVSSDAGLQELIEEKRDQGVFLSVLGFGMGNYKDNKMEVLADKGNGNYAYIDNFMEAKKVFVNEFGGTLFTIAKDVKLQVEFNPKQVEAYRLIGYENRKLNNEDFNDDQKDAGDMGAGHSVTAIYEVVPRGVTTDYVKAVDALKYQKTDETKASKSDEWMTVKLRYKQPDAATSVKFEHIVRPGLEEINNDAQFSIAVAQFGLLLRDSEFKGQASYDAVIELAKKSKGDDEEGYRAEFIKLVKAARLIDNRTARK